MRKRLLFGSLCIVVVVFSSYVVSAAEIGETLTSKEVVTLLSDKTFLVKQISRAEKGQNDYHGYFLANGQIQIKYTTSLGRTGAWKLGSEGIVCFGYMKRKYRRRKNNNREVINCGVLVKTGPNSFDRIDDQGEHTSSITLVGSGNKLPTK